MAVEKESIAILKQYQSAREVFTVKIEKKIIML
jgi:hypothetical protein